jgi:uncharacterized OsmC-like protein
MLAGGRSSQMNQETIQKSWEQWSAEPDKARSKPSVVATADGAAASIVAGPFSWRADLPPGLGGGNSAPSPTAMLLGALAGCAVASVRDTLAPQLGVTIDGLKATASCAADARGLLGMEEAVPDLQDLAITFEIDSPDPREKVEELLAVWRQRCPIYLALTREVPVRVSLA